MAVTPIQPVQRQQITRSKPSGTARGLGIAGGIGGAIVGGIKGAAKGAVLGGGVPGAIVGGLGAMVAGASGGKFIGEMVSPSKSMTDHRPVPTGGVPNKPSISRNGQLFAESLQILNQLPKEIAAPHSRALTAALMQDMAQTSGVV